MGWRWRDDIDFDERLENEIITDAKPDELWVGWYYDLPAAQQEPAQRLRTGQDASDGWWWLHLAPTLHETPDRTFAAGLAACFELFVQKGGNAATILPASHEIWSESSWPTWSLPGGTAQIISGADADEFAHRRAIESELLSDRSDVHAFV